MNVSRVPKWFDDAARLLAEGSSIADAARAVGCARESLSKRLNAPGSTLKAEVDRRRAALAADNSEKTKTTLERALEVLERGLESTDDRRAYDAAKVLLARLMPTQQIVKVEDQRAEQVSSEQVVRDLAGALDAVADLLDDVSNEAVQQLTDAATRLAARLAPVPRALSDATTELVSDAPAAVEVAALQ